MRRRTGDEKLPELWEKFKECRDWDARNDLIERYRHLAPLTTNRLLPELGPQYDREEAEAEAMLALLRAMESYNLQAGTQFETWAVTKIRGHLLDWLRDNDWIPRRVRKRIKAGEEVPVPRQVSLSDTWDLAEQVPDPAQDVERQALDRCEQQAVEEHMQALELVDQLILEAHFIGGLTLKETGEVVGLSEQRVHQRREKAVEKIRREMEPKTLVPKKRKGKR